MPMEHAQHLHEHGAHVAPDSIGAFFQRLTEVYVPRQQCMFYQADVIWMHIIADALIAAAYFSIPIALFYFVRRRKDLSFNWMFLMFAAFILFCGTTHAFNIISIWHPLYRLDGVIKLCTGLVSIATAVILWPLIPKAMALPSPTQMSKTNQRLEDEIIERRQVQEKLRRAYDDLELRVEQRTTELAESEARMRAIVEMAADGILVVDASGMIESFNPAAERIFGYTAEEVLGGDIQMLITEPYQTVLYAYFTPGESQGAPSYQLDGPGCRLGDNRYQEVQGRRKDGDTVPLELALSQTSLGAQRKFIGIVRDITERKRSEDALREAGRRKDEFLAMLAHELRNPLAPIRNAAYVMSLHKGGDPTIQKQFETINRQVGHMARLIDDLLDVSRITRGKIELKQEQVELQDVIRQAIEEVMPLVNRQGHQLHVDLPEAPIRVQADPARLQQVFSNLLNNAAKYMDAGGQIWLSLALQAGSAAIRIKDSGIGISPDVLPIIFDLFVQDDKSLDRARGGLGIGLTLVKMLVEMHRGSIEAHSAGPGSGAEFIVHLPAPGPAEKAGPAGKATAQSASGRHGCRVLVVDDNTDAADTLGILLRNFGHQVAVAYNGPQALQAAHDFQPEVVLLDIGLPGMDGYEVARRLRAEFGPERPLLIAVTGYGRAEDRAHASQAGFNHHLTKPVELDALMRLISCQHA